jgi:amidohydrolase
MPWLGVDPVTTAGHILVALQSVATRRVDLTQSPVVISIGAIHGGVRSNIIPDDVTMEGTIRTLDPEIRTEIHERIKETVAKIAESMGAKAEVTIDLGAPVTFNDPELTQRMVPTLERVAGPEQVTVSPPTTGAEDFSVFQQQIPGLYFFMGVTPADRDVEKAAPNHSPHFYVDESGLVLGVRAMTNLAWDYLTSQTE